MGTECGRARTEVTLTLGSGDIQRQRAMACTCGRMAIAMRASGSNV